MTAGTAEVPPAMSAKRENGFEPPAENFAPAARCGRDARGPSKRDDHLGERLDRPLKGVVSKYLLCREVKKFPR